MKYRLNSPTLDICDAIPSFISGILRKDNQIANTWRLVTNLHSPALISNLRSMTTEYYSSKIVPSATKIFEQKMKENSFQNKQREEDDIVSPNESSYPLTFVCCFQFVLSGLVRISSH